MKALPKRKLGGAIVVPLQGSRGQQQAAQAHAQAAAHVLQRPEIKLIESLAVCKQAANSTSYEASSHNSTVAATFNKYEFFLL